MKLIFAIIAMSFLSFNVFAESSSEVICRAQAKETAVQTYSSCITQARNNQIDQIRKNYQKDLTALKTKYDKELKKMTGSKTAGKQASASTAKTKILPTKKAVTTEKALPIRSTESDEVKVIAVGEEETSDIEKEATDADQVETVDMPTEE